MVRTCAIIGIIACCLSCADATVEETAPESIRAPGGITSVLTKKGMQLLDGKFLNEVQAIYPDGFLLQYPGEWNGQNLSTGDTPSQVRLTMNRLSVASPVQSGDTVIIPAQMDFAPFSLVFTSQNIENDACFIELELSEVSLSMPLSGGKTKARTFAFSLDAPTTSYVDVTLNSDCDEETIEGFPTNLSAQLTEWLEELITTSKGVLVSEMGLNIAFAGTSTRKGFDNSSYTLGFGITPGEKNDAISSRGGWLNLDLDVRLSSDGHESSPPFPPLTRALEAPEPLQASDLSTNTESPPFYYAVTLTRQAIQQVLWHTLHAGYFYEREQPLSAKQGVNLLNFMPGTVVAEGETTEFSYTLQAFSYPEVHLGTEGYGSVVRIFFPHIRAELNQIIDGAHVRLVSVDTPASFSLTLEFNSNLELIPKIRDVSVTGFQVRSPLWGEIDNGGPFAQELLGAIVDNMIEGPIFLPVSRPFDLLMGPIEAKTIGQEHLVFTFFMGVQSSNDD